MCGFQAKEKSAYGKVLEQNETRLRRERSDVASRSLSMDVETLKITRKPSRLIRGLGLWAATSIVIGGMIGQSVFLVASDMSREVGSLAKVLVAWMVGGVIVLFGSFCYGELGAAMPEAGGDYVYQSRGLSPLCGFLYGWTSSMIMRPGSAAIIAAGLLRFAGFLLPPVTRSIFTWNIRLPLQSQPYQFAFTYAQPLAALAIVIVAAMNYLGVRTVGRFQLFLTALKLAAVALILGLGFAAKNAIAIDRSVVTLSHRELVAFLTALVPVMAAYNGFQGLGPLGGEVLNPGAKSSKSRDSWNVTRDLCLSLDQLDVLPPAQLFPGSALSARCFRFGCSADRSGRRQVVHHRNDCFSVRCSPCQLPDRT